MKRLLGFDRNEGINCIDVANPIELNVFMRLCIDDIATPLGLKAVVASVAGGTDRFQSLFHVADEERPFELVSFFDVELHSLFARDLDRCPVGRRQALALPDAGRLDRLKLLKLALGSDVNVGPTVHGDPMS